MNNLEKKIENLEVFFKELSEKHGEMNKLLGDISRELRELKAEARTGNTSLSASTYNVDANNTNNLTDARHSHGSVYVNSAVNSRNSSTFSSAGNSVNMANSATSSDINTILSEYNKIFEYSGNDSKIARDNFARKYSVVGISCSNYAERVNSPSIPVMFETTQSLAKAHIWIIGINKGYVAFLNPNKGYDEPTHEFSGMKDVFNSNYDGGAYNSFRLTRPAVFQNSGGTWKVIRKGEIRL